MPERGAHFTGTDRFRVVRWLGRGGMGVVYEAHDRAWDQRVALKTLRHVEPAALLRLKREFRSLADVSHPNLVALYELISSANQWFFTMELVEGQDFLSYVRCVPPEVWAPERLGAQAETGDETASAGDATASADATADISGATSDGIDEDQTQSAPSTVISGAVLGPAAAVTSTAELAPPAQVERLRSAAAQLAEALAALHESGHLHRDVKPSNVMVTPQGRVVVLDFGLATELAPGRHSLTPSGRAGTIAYMAPEIIRNGANASEASDWYSFAVMLYESLAGRRPFVAAAEGILAAKLGHAPPRPSELRSGVPEDLDQLCHELLRVDPQQRPTAAQVLARLGAGVSGVGDHPPAPHPICGSTRLVGRETQLASLNAALAAAREGRGSSVLLKGPSGTGKTALVRCFLDQVEDAVVLQGRCYERENVPYKALDSIVDALCSYLVDQPESVQAAVLSDDRQALVNAFPVFRRLRGLAQLPVEGVSGAGTKELRRRAFVALRQLAVRMANHRPLVLFIDDLQWGDAESAPLLIELMQRPAASLLLVATYRSEGADSSALLRALATARAEDPDFAANVQEIPVGPLTGDDAALLARSLLVEMGEAERVGDLLGTVAAESEGNPLFIQEFIRFALPRSSQDLGGLGLDSMIRARMDDLSPAARGLLQVIAVAGWRLPQRGALEATGHHEQQLRALAELRAGQFVRTDGAGPAARVECYHDRVREAVVASIEQATQAEIHARLAPALERCMSDGAERTYALANHYFLGGEADQRRQAFELNYLAGRLALEALAFARARRFLSQARELADALELPVDARLAQLLGEACAWTGRIGSAAHYFHQALHVAREPRQRALIRYSLSKLHLGRMDSRAAHSEVELGLRELGQLQRRNTVGLLVGALWSWLVGWWFLGRGRHRRLTSERREEYRELAELQLQAAYVAYFEMDVVGMLAGAVGAYAAAARTGRSSELAEAYVLLGSIAGAKGWGRRAERLGDEAVTVAAMAGPAARARMQLFRGFIAHFVGDTDGARDRHRNTLEEHARLLENVDYLTGVGDICWNLLMRGYPVEGWAWAERGLRRAALSRNAKATQGHTYRCYIGPLLTMLGRHAEGMQHLDDFRQVIADTPQDRWRWAQYLAHRALALVLHGEIGEPLEQVIAEHRALRLAPARVPLQLRQFYVAQAYARLWQYRQAPTSGRPTARARLRWAIRQLKRTGHHATLTAHRRCIEAAFDTTEGRRARANRRLAQAEEIARQTDNLWVLAEVDYQRATIEWDAGDREAAREKARGMLRFASQRGWQQRVRQVCEQFGLENHHHEDDQADDSAAN